MSCPMVLPGVSWMLLSCLMFLSQVQAGDFRRASVPSPRVSCPKGSQAYASRCYALFTTPRSWFDADLACQKRPSGHLVSMLSGAEASFVSSLVKNRVKNQDVWIGLHDPTLGQQPNGGGWEWSNDDVMNYLNWDGNSSSPLDHGYCGSLTEKSEFLKWRDHLCDKPLPYICKFKN